MIHRLIASILPHIPKKIIWLFSCRYIPGITLEDAVRVSVQLHGAGAFITVDRLGEFISDMAQARMNRDAYFEIVERYSVESVNATFSLKPSGFGLLIDFEECYRLVREVLIEAAKTDRLVRIDMEDSTCVDAELELFRRLHAEYPLNVGLAIQSYLRRTERDLESIVHWHTNETPLNIRLCKGIYNETEIIAYKKPAEINLRYLKDLEFLLSRGVYVGIATHDKELVSGALNIIDRLGLLSNQYEFQMLYGVTPDLRAEIIGKGHHLRVYVPFGEEWFGYSTRRLKENPKMVGHILKALVVRG